ncbi:MAG: helix-turn-helix transcriptional regulator [Bacteroidales bacterium]|jgi:DNA-binding PadR family transcriptional regulator|nr:helix-turn-helix transcriptional regulator [Bacteroidales bacterium]
MGTMNQALTEAVFYILLALQKPLHGYGIMQKTSEFSKGRLVLSAGTLYGALSNLIDKGWISPYNQTSDLESRRKEYIITDEGMMILEAELERLQELVSNGNKHIIR